LILATEQTEYGAWRKNDAKSYNCYICSVATSIIYRVSLENQAIYSSMDFWIIN